MILKIYFKGHAEPLEANLIEGAGVNLLSEFQQYLSRGGFPAGGTYPCAGPNGEKDAIVVAFNAIAFIPFPMPFFEADQSA